MTQDPRIVRYEQEYAAGVEIAHKAMISSYIGPPPKLRGDAERMVAALLVAGWTPPVPAAPPVEYVIWSNEHRAWWAPNWRSYTLFIEEAGRYPRDVAAGICEGANISQNERVPDGYRAEVMIPDPDVELQASSQQLPALEQASPQLHDGRQARQALEDALGVPRAAGGIDALSMSELAAAIAAEIERLRRTLTEKAMSNGRTIQNAIELEEQFTATNARLSRKLREMAARVTMWRRCTRSAQAERDEARNTFLDHYGGASGHLDRIRQLEEGLRERTGERDAARAELAHAQDGCQRALERKKQLTAELAEMRRKTAALRAQVAGARVFPADWRVRLSDLPRVATRIAARVIAEIESWSRPRPLTAVECRELAAALLNQAAHLEQQSTPAEDHTVRGDDR